MNAVKKFFLRYKTKTNLKTRSYQQSSNFEKSSRIALLYSDQFSDQKGIESLIKELRSEGKELGILVYCHNPKSISTSHMHLSLPDISFTGHIKKDEVSFLLKQHYDFAICLDTTGHYAIDYLFSSIQAKCRVGNMHPDRKNLFEMMVSADKKETDLCCEVLKYLKMIKTYEN